MLVLIFSLFPYDCARACVWSHYWHPIQLHPNVITYVNHMANWMLLCLAFLSVSMPRPWAVAALVTCALINFACMMLDW